MRTLANSEDPDEIQVLYGMSTLFAKIKMIFMCVCVWIWIRRRRWTLGNPHRRSGLGRGMSSSVWWAFWSHRLSFILLSRRDPGWSPHLRCCYRSPPGRRCRCCFLCFLLLRRVAELYRPRKIIFREWNRPQKKESMIIRLRAKKVLLSPPPPP